MGTELTFENGVILLGMIYSICLHEAAHAFTADWLGDDTPRLLGKTTFNPIPHIQTSPFFTLVLPIAAFLLYGGFIGGGPRPAAPPRRRKPRRDEFLVAFAGPLANLWICGLCTMLLIYVHGPIAHDILLRLGLMNLSLAVFNLLPIPPFDGSRMLGCVIPGLRPIFRSLTFGGVAQIVVIAYFVGGAIMQQIMPTVFRAYLRLLAVLGV